MTLFAEIVENNLPNNVFRSVRGMYDHEMVRAQDRRVITWLQASGSPVRR